MVHVMSFISRYKTKSKSFEIQILVWTYAANPERARRINVDSTIFLGNDFKQHREYPHCKARPNFLVNPNLGSKIEIIMTATCYMFAVVTLTQKWLQYIEPN